MNLLMSGVLYAYIFMIALVNTNQIGSEIIGDNTNKLAHCVYIDQNKHLFTLQNLTNFYYAINFTAATGETGAKYYFNPCEPVFTQHEFSTKRNNGSFCKSNSAENTKCAYYYSYMRNTYKQTSNMTQLFQGQKDEKGEYILNPYILLQLDPGSINSTEITETTDLDVSITMNITCSVPANKLPSFFGENKGLIDSTNNYVMSRVDLEKVEGEKTGKFTVRLATSLQCFYENYYIGNNFFYQYPITRFISGGIMLITALYYLTIASKHHQTTFILSNGLALAYVSFSIVFNLCNSFRKVTFHSMIWIVVVILIGFILGCLVGLICVLKKQTNFNIFIMNLGTGLMISFFLFHVGLKYLHEHLDTTYWITIVVFSFGVALVAKYHQFNNTFVIISSVSVGGFLLVKSISIFIGSNSKFGSDNIIADLSFWKEEEQLKTNLSSMSYIYLVGWVIVSTVSALFQRKLSSPKDEEH